MAFGTALEPSEDHTKARALVVAPSPTGNGVVVVQQRPGAASRSGCGYSFAGATGGAGSAAALSDTHFQPQPFSVTTLQQVPDSADGAPPALSTIVIL